MTQNRTATMIDDTITTIPETDIQLRENPNIKSDNGNILSATLDTTDTEEHKYIQGYKLLAALIGIVSVFFVVLLDLSIISTAIPNITSEFHRLQDVGWYGGAYQLLCATLQPVTGKLYTHLSAKPVFLFFFAIFEIGSLLCAVSTSSIFFILGRAVAGVGASGLENGAITLLAGAVPLHERPFYTSIVFAVGQVGIALGPLIGGAHTWAYG